MIRLVALIALVGFTLPAFAQDEPSPALTEALQQCIEAVNDSKAADDGSGDVPGLDQCIAVGSNACQEEPGGSPRKASPPAMARSSRSGTTC
ncbi:MAG: hypothetical protein ABIQ30_14295 [Devosia sp.]